MIGRKNFKRYWKAGFFFALVSSGVNFLLTIVSNYLGSLPVKELRIEALGSTITYPAQPEWMVIAIIIAVATVIVVPLIYGKLIEVFHKKFLIEKKTQMTSA
jgi:di/tricarboxylate transporter